MSAESIKNLIDEQENNMGGGGTTMDRGEHKEDGKLSIFDITVELENQIVGKFQDPRSPNYKVLSKKIITSLKSNAGFRQNLL